MKSCPNFYRTLHFAPQIVQYYGTHVLIDIYTGAKLDMLFQSETISQDREYASRIGIKASVKNIFDFDIDNNIDASQSSNTNFNKKLSYRTRGGDPSKGLVGGFNLDQSNSKINISNWQNSSTTENSVLVDFGQNGLIYIYDLVQDVSKRSELKAYVDQYLIDNQARLQYSNPLNLSDGNFVINKFNGDVYFIFENKLRYIQSPMTVFGLFNISSADIRDVYPTEISGIERGLNLPPDNDLKQDAYTKKIYLREGKTLRWTRI